MFVSAIFFQRCLVSYIWTSFWHSPGQSFLQFNSEVNVLHLFNYTRILSMYPNYNHYMFNLIAYLNNRCRNLARIARWLFLLPALFVIVILMTWAYQVNLLLNSVYVSENVSIFFVARNTCAVRSFTKWSFIISVYSASPISSFCFQSTLQLKTIALWNNSNS